MEPVAASTADPVGRRSDSCPSSRRTAQPNAVKKKHDGKSQLVLDQLKGIDLINMTPLQALNLVYEWKQKLQ